MHLSVPEHPEASGERMRALAALAGLGSQTHVHGVFDMGTWIRPQFVQCFGGYKFTICADQMHVLEYLGDAAKTLWPQPDQEVERANWFDAQKGHLRASRWRTVRDALGDGEQEGAAILGEPSPGHELWAAPRPGLARGQWRSGGRGPS